MGDEFNRGKDEIGNGGVFPRAAGEVASGGTSGRRGGVKGRQQRRLWWRQRSRHDAWSRWRGNRDGGAVPAAVRSPARRKQGHGSAARRDEGSRREQRDGVGLGKAGEVGCKPNQRRGRPMGGKPDGGGAAELQWSWR